MLLLEAVILRPAELPRKDRGHGAVTVPLVGSHLGAITLLKGITTFDPGAAIGHHSHNCVESVAVIKGTAYVDIDGTEYYLSTYDTTFVPANIVHRFRNASGTEPMRISGLTPPSTRPAPRPTQPSASVLIRNRPASLQ